MNLLEELLIEAHDRKASDLHLTVGSSPVFRINGELSTFHEFVIKPADTEFIAKEMLNEELSAKLNKDKEIDLSYSISGVSRFRVNIYFQRGCISLAFRTIPKEVPTIESLRLPSSLQSIVEKENGLVLVTGPTGSGKSSTLAAMVNHMNHTMKRHIITLEDPIEYLHSHHQSIIDQREIGFDAKNFKSGLRACLRQDPDVILVGEMRDLETISIAITAAETGHLVLGTLHTSDVMSTVHRIIDVFPATQKEQIRIQLASVLHAIISQKLFPTTDKTGRIATTEILINNPAIQNVIRNDKIHQIPNIVQTSRELGMHTFEQDITRLRAQGAIDREGAKSHLTNGNF
ncbi:type IV pilus twitching motility protein PilT [Gracilibacillus caseinilyticus]|uniref:Type IV pilus twitching motility protein PilT n=1 Tax=Gracilibacillus caseinilyticus TaxID=2932256 RepID=A0ABY4ES83_9BACI|nr:type IV pilus twitching motility protein PilT [Gracilibacillus caseinilyticus]UOQ47289.1 type IV pilus twitching motility protein PilT [Gracilibacillus caseinilyticus]